MNTVVLFQLCFIYYMGYSMPQNLQQPPSTFPTDKSKYKILDKDETLFPTASELAVPHVFPANDSNHKFVSDSKILKKLRVSSHTNPEEHHIVIDTEVQDLLKTNHNHTLQRSPVNETITTITNNNQVPLDLNDAESIQSDASKTEDIKFNNTSGGGGGASPTILLSTSHRNHDHLHKGGVTVIQGQLAAILAVTFAIVAVASYMGLLVWRKFLENRYGNREMLVNEEEYVNVNYSNSSMKNFEL